MSLVEDNSPRRPDQELEAPVRAEDSLPPPLAGDAFSSPPAGCPENGNSLFPEHLRISWSWPHLMLFAVFGFISLFAVQLTFFIYYTSPGRHFANKQEFEQFVFSKPFFAIGSMVVWEALLILFLYVTIAVLPDAPFWRSLGWRKIGSHDPARPPSPWRYLFFGCLLSIGVFIATAKTKAPENAPIEELFKNRNTMFLFIAMAVLFAPLVEETLFRGYLFPLLARFSSFLACSLGADSAVAVRGGILSSIIFTGVLFGLVHGYQLGWSPSLVLTLTIVGVILTYVRARTGTVYASYLLHLGYNATFALASIIGFFATKGFTQMPPGH